MGSCTMEKCVILLSVLVLVWAPLGLSDEGHQVPDYCKLFPPTEPSKESCVKFIPQFFYNSTSQDCDTFIYGGCGGNKNRFRSHRSCMDTCHHGVVPVKPVTSAVEDCGQARSRHCDRTANDCNQAPDPGPCLAYFPQYFYNATTNECEIFIYGGCSGNNNRFESLAACKKNCRAEFNSTEVCHLPPKTGPCKAAFPKLYYNPESHRCEPFIYGGCDGNDNQFESIKDCMQTCHPEGKDVIITLLPEASMQLRGKPHACILPAESGPCRANLPRYFYNSATHRCEKFTYGGCGGNANKFVSARECNLVCHQNTQQQLTETAGTDPTDICHLPAEMGRCLALIPRYYYNHQTESCEVFIYGGCQGNQNNFVDEEQCMKTCKKD